MPSQTTQTHSDRKNSSAVTTKSGARQTWVRFVVPSAADLLFVALLLGLSCGAMGGLLLRDSDIGWHIRDGQQILLTHATTRTDSFSSTMSGHTWYAWEWLYDVLIAAIDHVFGLNGVVFFTAAVVAATFALSLKFALLRGGNLAVTFFLLILSLGASAVHFLARPHVLSWLFVVIWFELLDSDASAHQASQRLLWLPVMMAVWVNLHGGFVLGFLLVAVYLIGGAIEYVINPEQRRRIAGWLKYLGGIAALTLVASFINPYSYHLHLHIYRYLSDRFLMSQISEFLSPDFHGAAQQCFAVLLIVAIATPAVIRRGLSASRLLVLLFAAYSGLYATRNLPTSALLITLVIAPVLSTAIGQATGNPKIVSWLRQLLSGISSFGFRMQRLDSDLRGHVLTILVLAIGVWACWHQGRIGSIELMNAHFDESRFPVKASNYIAGHGVHEPIFSLDYWGGYLIYRLYPETKVVVDDRHDLYGDQFIKNYLKIVLVQPTFAEELDQMKINWVLVPRWSSLANVLRLTRNWTVVFEDGNAALFRRN